MTVDRDRAFEPDNPQAFYTVADLAARWHVCRRTVFRLLRSGRLVGHKLGASWRVSHHDLCVYETRCRCKQPRTICRNPKIGKIK
jgi:excisionase family DNA binding protein